MIRVLSVFRFIIFTKRRLPCQSKKPVVSATGFTLLWKLKGTGQMLDVRNAVSQEGNRDDVKTDGTLKSGLLT